MLQVCTNWLAVYQLKCIDTGSCLPLSAIVHETLVLADSLLNLKGIVQRVWLGASYKDISDHYLDHLD